MLTRTVPRALAALVLFGLVAVAGYLWQSGLADHWLSGRGGPAPQPGEERAYRQLIARGPPPPVLPVKTLDVARDTARMINAKVPFSTAPNPAAAPFRFTGDAAAKALAVDCLASAQYYEAGTDLVGQRAVAQVVLNRVRHPAFPSTVCGVVFQGSERQTGCQFTFTCDGALARRPLPALWRKSRQIALEALNGAVFAPVGHATHYHTDWVVPYWSGELDKITNVATHLFFRWRGNWGKPIAFRKPVSPLEPRVAKLAWISDLHFTPGMEPGNLAADAAAPGDGASSVNETAAALPPRFNLRGSKLVLASPAGDAYGFLLPKSFPGSFFLLSLDLCRAKSRCKVMGWTDADAVPAQLPDRLPPPASVAFLYVYDRPGRSEIIAWNCDVFPRKNPAECLQSKTARLAELEMKGTASAAAPARTATVALTAEQAAAMARKSEPAPADP